jgi:tetraacyldisaccharide 4'-kinase
LAVFEKIWKSFLSGRAISLWSLLVPFMWLGTFLYRIGLWGDRLRKGTKVRVSKPVISIGNITVGGTGKTPLVAFLAEGLMGRGIRVGIASSGYGRGSQECILGSANEVGQLGADVCGDEVVMLARKLSSAQFAVDGSKWKAAKRLADSGLVDVVIVDDGFQHHKLWRDLDMVTFDASVPQSILHLLPWGVLREPLISLRRASTLVITRSDLAGDIQLLRHFLSGINPGAEQYTARFVPTELVGRDGRFPVTRLKGKKVFLFAGIGSFEQLRQIVTGLAGSDVAAFELADHQHYDSELLARIRDEAARVSPDLIVTTSKDWVKVAGFDFGRECCYLEQTTELDPDGESLLSGICAELHLKTETD